MDILLELIFAIIIPFVLVSYIIIHRENAKRKSLIKNSKAHRFKYIDTFYYSVNFDGNTDFTVYHIISDLETSKIYAINEGNFLPHFFNYKFGNVELKTGIGAGSIPVNFGAEGTFWIEKELDAAYKGSFRRVGVKHVNNNYPFSLIEEATFIAGYAELDILKNRR